MTTAVPTDATDSKAAPAFTDAAGEEWPIVLTMATYRRCRAAGFDLPFRAADIPAVAAVVDDPERFADLLWLVCEPDRANAGKPGFLDRHAPPPTKDEFLGRLSGEALNAAAFALVDAVIHFAIPAAGPRELYKQKYRQHAAAAEEEMMAAMTAAAPKPGA